MRNAEIPCRERMERMERVLKASRPYIEKRPHRQLALVGCCFSPYAQLAQIRSCRSIRSINEFLLFFPNNSPRLYKNNNIKASNVLQAINLISIIVWFPTYIFLIPAMVILCANKILS